MLPHAPIISNLILRIGVRSSPGASITHYLPGAPPSAHVCLVTSRLTGTWTLTGAKPKSYKGATLNAKGGTEVAMEELVLSVESIDVS